MTVDFSYVHLFGTKMRHLPTSHFEWALTHSLFEPWVFGYDVEEYNSLRIEKIQCVFRPENRAAKDKKSDFEKNLIHFFGTKTCQILFLAFKWTLIHSRIETQEIGYELGATNNPGNAKKWLKFIRVFLFIIL